MNAWQQQHRDYGRADCGFHGTLPVISGFRFALAPVQPTGQEQYTSNRPVTPVPHVAHDQRASSTIRWQLEKRGGRWTLGTLFVHDKPVDAPLASGIPALSNSTSRQVLWPAATEAKQLDERSARVTGSEKIGDVLFRFEVEVALQEDLPAATLAPRGSVDQDLDGFEVCLAYQGVGGNDWRVQSYHSGAR